MLAFAYVLYFINVIAVVIIFVGWLCSSDYFDRIRFFLTEEVNGIIYICFSSIIIFLSALFFVLQSFLSLKPDSDNITPLDSVVVIHALALVIYFAGTCVYFSIMGLCKLQGFLAKKRGKNE